jgi:hypothetical protein
MDSTVDHITNSAQHKSIKIESRDRVKNNKGWSKISETEATKISHTTWAWAWMHYKSYQMFSAYDERITIIIVILSAALILPQLAQTNETNDKLLRVFSIVMNILIAILSGYKQVVAYGVRSQQHKESSAQFNRIYESIKLELLLYRVDRQSADEFIKYKSQIIDIYLSSAPDIDDKIIEQFTKLFPNISLPSIISQHYDFVIELPDESNGKQTIENIISMEQGKQIKLTSDNIDNASSFDFGLFKKTVSPKSTDTKRISDWSNTHTLNQSPNINTNQPDNIAHSINTKKVYDILQTKIDGIQKIDGIPKNDGIPKIAVVDTDDETSDDEAFDKTKTKTTNLANKTSFELARLSRI